MFFRRKKLTETEFANKFAQALRQKIKGIDIISINGLEVVSKLDDSDEHRHFLDNAYIEYSHDTKKLKEVIEKYASVSADSFLPNEPVSPESILPVIKGKQFIKGLLEINPKAGAQQVLETYNSDLDIFYVVDTEHALRYLTSDEQEKLGLEMDELRELAIRNLDKFDIRSHGEEGYYMITAGGTYEASMILLDIWNKGNFDVNGDIIIGIPARDLLVVTGSKDWANLHKMYDLVKEVSETGNYLVSDKLFELKGDRFEVLG
ncbi:DUF1444 family protein [Flavobacterium sp. MFBS3-15]|uniref:DUF1444 family protein n=1 Tax=Flavobacterium sp. MFBS3-15 TaxID=2989816 RepID=UPI00223622E7|nr:DUF1444 family protein [Flavobacterium sp. MFBS3-15]MCW4470000.1 DUF1444 family protein [Flavobacterium sp. MFBS3-15]